MIEFKMKPIQQIVIHDLVQETLENLLYQYYASENTYAFWADGIIISIDSTSGYEESFKKLLEGIKIFERVVFVKYPKYTKNAKWNGGNFEVMLLNCNNNPLLKALAKWIKTQSIWKTTTEGSQ